MTKEEPEQSMPHGRWLYLMNPANDEVPSEQEIADGWHFCWEFDGLLVNANDPYVIRSGCTCLKDLEPSQT